MSAASDYLATVNALVKARKQRGMTQTDLALILKTQRQTVSAWESGQNFPPSDKLFAWAGALRVRILPPELPDAPANATQNGATPDERRAA
ncbi:helix-turn-helix transcriptional regulator [Azospirillum canadense]|uniref:helix-turn-helix transcriptional regulator n=1 Tax=Azospirillum canadense TaxID=403962 RepID=UPI002225CDE6|nr:helix-turn-helix transcriptional regulator [Azospirillum canadense]MCW2242201.1 transcriptional regulator with XRE-family HTH domain [Azospirillum canadense]